MHSEKGVFVSVNVDDIKKEGKNDNLKPCGHIDETSWSHRTDISVRSIVLGCTQRACEPNFKIVKTERLSRIFDLSRRYQTITWLGEIPRGYCRLVAKTCMERFCELAKKKIEQWYRVSTPCMDDLQFKDEKLETVENYQTFVCKSSWNACILHASAGLTFDGL